MVIWYTLGPLHLECTYSRYGTYLQLVHTTLPKPKIISKHLHHTYSTTLQITEQLKFPTLGKRFTTFLWSEISSSVGNLFVVPVVFLRETFLFVESTRGDPPHATRIAPVPKENGRFSPSLWRWPWRPRPWSWWHPLP
jgi:hypothetical protein